MEVDDNGTKSVLHKKYFFCASTKRRAEKENEKCGKSFSPKKKKQKEFMRRKEENLWANEKSQLHRCDEKGEKEKRENFLID